eukprot:Gb_29768 [translate_table: standard]
MSLSRFEEKQIEMAHALQNQKKMTLVVGLMINLQVRKCNVSVLKGEGSVTYSCTEDVRNLCKKGRLKEALHILHVLDRRIASSTYICLLQGCSKKKALSEGKLVHTHITETGFLPDIFIQNTLLNMYAKCGSLVEARRVFDQMPEHDVVSWTAMIGAYARQGYAKDALALFYRMYRTGIEPDQFIFASVLPACDNLTDLKDIHEEIMKSGFQSDVFVGSALVDMYAKCGSIQNARNVFDKMSRRDVALWNAIITGYAQNGFMDEALKLFKEMPERNVVSWTSMIAGYSQNGHVHEALELFEKMPERNVVSWNSLIAGYAQKGHMHEARKLFQNMPERNVVSWTAMMAGYVQNGNSEEALKLFRQMQLAGVKPNLKTFASVLPACTSLADLEQGMEIHEEIIKSGFHSDVFVESALVDMYAKCGSIEKARDLFNKMHQRNTISWTVMIAGYVHNGCLDEASKLFQKMPDRDVVSWTAMIAGYAQNGHVDEALKLFQIMPKQDVVSWTAMITGYVQNGQAEEALNLFQQMQLTGVKPDTNTYTSVLPACASLAALEQGIEIHEAIVRSGFQSDVCVTNALVDMYAKCGNIDNARDVFDNMPQRDVISWTGMIGAYAMHGYGKEALKLFEEMQHSGTNPNHVTFICILSACCHAGLVDEGRQYFDCMRQCYHITPSMEHYSCMVDLLGRAGHLDETLDFINKMQIKPDATVWGCLLGACRVHNNIKLGEHVAERLFELDPKNAAPYVLLSNIYASAGKWNDIEKVRKMMKGRRVKKKPGCSWIEVNKKVYAFLI